MLTNNFILKLHNVPLKSFELRENSIIDIVLHSYDYNKAMSFKMNYSFTGTERKQSLLFKTVPIPEVGLLFFIKYIDEKLFPLLNSNLDLSTIEELNEIQKLALIKDFESNTFNLLTYCNNDFIILEKDLTVSDQNLKDNFKFLVKNNKELYFIADNDEKQYYNFVFGLISKNIIKDCTIFTNININGFGNILIIYFQKLSYLSDRMILIVSTEENSESKNEIVSIDKFDYKHYLQYPKNHSINVIQAKAIKYFTNFTTVFNLYYNKKQFPDLNYYHEEFISSIKDRQFDAKHLLKFYLALTLSNPIYKLSRKELLKILVETNLLSYSIFSKIFPVFKSESHHLLYEKDGKICLNEELEIKKSLNELFLKSFALMNEIAVQLRIDNYETNFESDLELNLQVLFENNQVSINQKLEIISEIIKDFMNDLKKNANNNFDKVIVIISKEIPWYYGYVIGLNSRPFKTEFVPLLKEESGQYYSNSDQNEEENFIVETNFQGNDENWNDLIIVLNLNLIITTKVVDYQKEHYLKGLLVNYYPEFNLKEKSSFVQKSFNEKIVVDLKKRLNDLHHDVNILKIHIFCAIDFDLGLKLAQADLFQGIKHVFYTWDSEKASFLQMKILK